MTKQYSSMKWTATFRAWASVVSQDPSTWNQHMTPLEEWDLVETENVVRFDSRKTSPIPTELQLQPQIIDQFNVGQAVMDLREQT